MLSTSVPKENPPSGSDTGAAIDEWTRQELIDRRARDHGGSLLKWQQIDAVRDLRLGRYHPTDGTWYRFFFRRADRSLYLDRVAELVDC